MTASRTRSVHISAVERSGMRELNEGARQARVRPRSGSPGQVFGRRSRRRDKTDPGAGSPVLAGDPRALQGKQVAALRGRHLSFTILLSAGSGGLERQGTVTCRRSLRLTPVYPRCGVRRSRRALPPYRRRRHALSRFRQRRCGRLRPGHSDEHLIGAIQRQAGKLMRLQPQWQPAGRASGAAASSI